MLSSRLPSPSWRAILSSTLPFLSTKRQEYLTPDSLDHSPMTSPNINRIPGLEDPTPDTMEEWLIYMNLNPSEIPQPLNITKLWESMAGRFPNLSSIAKEVIWMPVASVDVERSFSQYKHLLNDRRESLTQQNTKMLAMMYFNGDIENQFT